MSLGLIEAARSLQQQSAQLSQLATMSETLLKSQQRIQSLFKVYPQLDRLNHSLAMLNLPQSTMSKLSHPAHAFKVEVEIYEATDTLVNKVHEQGVIQDNLPDEATVQTLIFVVCYFITSLSPDELISWVSQLPSMLLEQINFMGNPTLSGLFNIWTLLSICAWIYSKCCENLPTSGERPQM